MCIRDSHDGDDGSNTTTNYGNSLADYLTNMVGNFSNLFMGQTRPQDSSEDLSREIDSTPDDTTANLRNVPLSALMREMASRFIPENFDIITSQRSAAKPCTNEFIEQLPRTNCAELSNSSDECPICRIAYSDDFETEITCLPNCSHPVSYTHLDVYKRQPLNCLGDVFAP